MAKEKSKNKGQKKIKRNGITRQNPWPYRKQKRRPGRPKGSTKKHININEQEQLFADLILENMHKTKKKKLNYSECYRIAYNNYKMKDASAQVTASKLASKPKIKQYIQERKRAAAGRVEITIARVLKGLLRIAEFDPRELFDKKGRPIPVHKLPKDVALGVSGLEISSVSRRLPSGRRKLTYYPKNVKHEARKPAWELLGTHIDMWAQNANTNTPQDFVNEIRSFADSLKDAIPGGQI